MKKHKTTDALEIIHSRYYRGKPARMASLERERVNAKIAREILSLRTKYGLTQKKLAGLVGTTPSVISRLENADYSGHSLGMLQRIAFSLNSRVDVRFVPMREAARAGKR